MSVLKEFYMELLLLMKIYKIENKQIILNEIQELNYNNFIINLINKNNL